MSTIENPQLVSGYTISCYSNISAYEITCESGCVCFHTTPVSLLHNNAQQLLSILPCVYLFQNTIMHIYAQHGTEYKLLDPCNLLISLSVQAMFYVWFYVFALSAW